MNEERSLFNWIYLLKRDAQLKLARYSVIAFATASSIAVALSFANDPSLNGEMFLLPFIFLAWLCAAYIGMQSSYYIFYPFTGNCNRPPAPSWNGAIFTAILTILLIAMLNNVKDYSDIISGVSLGINIAYIGAKVRCRVLRCCEQTKKGGVFNFLLRRNLFLQEVEIVLTFLIIIVSILLLYSNELIGCSIVCLLGHGTIRYVDFYLRFKRISPNQACIRSGFYYYLLTSCILFFY